MLAWLFLAGRVALLAYERVAVKKLGEKASALAAGFLFFSFGALALIPFALLEPVADWSFLPYALVSGTLYSFADALYVYALSTERVSVVAPLYNTNLVFLVFLAFFIAHDSLSVAKIAGVLLIVAGAGLLTKNEFSLRELLSNKAALAILASAFIFAALRSVDALAFKTVQPPAFVYAAILFSIVSLAFLAMLALTRRLREAKRLFEQRPLLSIKAGAVNGFSYLFLLLAIREIEVSLAEPVSMLSMPLAVLLAQRQLGEKPSWKGVALIAFGTWVLFL